MDAVTTGRDYNLRPFELETVFTGRRYNWAPLPLDDVITDAVTTGHRYSQGQIFFASKICLTQFSLPKNYLPPTFF